MQFSEALNQLKQGLPVARTNWNGKGMYVYLVEGGIYPSKTEVAKKQFGNEVPYRAYLAMKTVDDEVVPWVASQTDILAEDWFLVKDEE